MATQADLENAVRKVLNEGTAYGQPNWAETSQAILKSIQTLHNLLVQEVIPRLPSPGTPVQTVMPGGMDQQDPEDTDAGPHGDEEEASQEKEVPDGDS